MSGHSIRVNLFDESYLRSCRGARLSICGIAISTLYYSFIMALVRGEQCSWTTLDVRPTSPGIDHDLVQP